VPESLGLSEWEPIIFPDHALLIVEERLREHKIIAQIYPEGSPARRKTEQRSVRFFRALLEYYPDSQWASKARQDLEELEA
jgi:hypothetical protein